MAILLCICWYVFFRLRLGARHIPGTMAPLALDALVRQTETRSNHMERLLFDLPIRQLHILYRFVFICVCRLAVGKGCL